MSLFSMLESTGYLQRPTIGRDTQQGVTQTPWNTVSAVVPCSVQSANSSVKMLYMQRNTDIIVTIYFAQDIGAQVNDRFIATDTSGVQSTILVLSESQQVDRGVVWVLNGIEIPAPTGTSTSVGVAGFLITLPAESPVGYAFSFSVQAIDAQGNIVTTYGGTVQFYSSDFSAVLPSPATLTAGVGTFSATLNTVGTQQIGAQDSANYAVNTLSGTIDVYAAVVPDAPENLIVTGGNLAAGTNQLSWSAATHADYYQIWRGTSPGTETLYQNNLLVLSYADSSVVIGTTYYYEIVAVNPVGSSDPSDEASSLAFFLPWIGWSGLKYVADFNNTYTTWKEDVSSISTTSALTHATTNGDTIGQVDDYSVSAHSLICLSAGTRPTQISLAGRASGALFTFSPSNVLQVQNSTKAFSFVQKTASFCFCVRVNCNAHDATSMIIADNCAATSANSGFFLNRNSSNKLVFTIVRGGGTVASVTSATSVNVASGWVSVIVEGDGVNLRIYLGSTTFDATATIGTLGTLDASFSLVFGRTTGGTTPFDGTLTDIVIGSGTLTTQQKTDYFNYNPAARISENPVGWLAGVTMLHSAFDFTGQYYAGVLWQDSRGGTSSYTNNAIVALAAAANDSTGALNRDASAPSGKEPVFLTLAPGNSIPASFWNGTNTELDFSTWPSGGARTMIIAMRNIGADQISPHSGSTMLGDNSGSARWVIGSSAADPPLGHITWGLNGGTAVASPALVNAPENWNIGVMRRVGNQIELWVNGQNYTTSTSNLGFSPVQMGKSSQSILWMYGYGGVIQEYSAYLPDSILDTQLLAIATALEIPNVVAI
jgi:concanavalin A-like lectin/glucanase superfamily protein